MIQFLKTFLYELMLLWPFSSTGGPITLTRIAEKFDVVERVPAYTRIKH